MKYYSLKTDLLTPAIQILAALSKTELQCSTITQHEIQEMKDNFEEPGLPPYLETGDKNIAGFKEIFLFMAQRIPSALGLYSQKEGAEKLIDSMILNLLPTLAAVDQYLGIVPPNKVTFTLHVKSMKSEIQKFNRLLSLRPFLLGYNPSVADILFIVMLTPAFTHLIGPSLQSEFSGVVDYYFRTTNLPFFKMLPIPAKLQENKLPSFPESAEEEKEMPTLEARKNTISLNDCVIDKPKKDMIFVHGLSGYGSLFKNWLMLPEFTNRRRIFLPDMRNHGKSAHTASMNYELMAEDVLRYADEKGLNTFTLMGHSMGGKISAYIAQIAPERLNGVLILDSPLVQIYELEKNTPEERRLNVNKKLEAASTFDIESCTTLKEAIEKLAVHLGDPVLAKRMSINIVVHESGKHMKWLCNLKGIVQSYPMPFKTFNPYKGDDFVIVVGEKSFEFNKAHYNHVFTKLEEDRHVRVIKGAGHNIFVDNLAETNKAICEFLDRIDGAQL